MLIFLLQEIHDLYLMMSVLKIIEIYQHAY